MDQNLIVIGEIWTRILLSWVKYGPEFYRHRRFFFIIIVFIHYVLTKLYMLN